MGWMSVVKHDVHGRRGWKWCVLWLLTLPMSLLGSLDHKFSHSQMVHRRIHAWHAHVAEFSLNDCLEIFLLCVQLVMLLAAQTLNGNTAKSAQVAQFQEIWGALFSLLMLCCVVFIGYAWRTHAVRVAREVKKYQVKEMMPKGCCGRKAQRNTILRPRPSQLQML